MIAKLTNIIKKDEKMRLFYTMFGEKAVNLSRFCFRQ